MPEDSWLHCGSQDLGKSQMSWALAFLIFFLCLQTLGLTATISSLPGNNFTLVVPSNSALAGSAADLAALTTMPSALQQASIIPCFKCPLHFSAEPIIVFTSFSWELQTLCCPDNTLYWGEHPFGDSGNDWSPVLAKLMTCFSGMSLAAVLDCMMMPVHYLVRWKVTHLTVWCHYRMRFLTYKAGFGYIRFDSTCCKPTINLPSSWSLPALSHHAIILQLTVVMLQVVSQGLIDGKDLHLQDGVILTTRLMNSGLTVSSRF